jgi:hypothetical protein
MTNQEVLKFAVLRTRKQFLGLAVTARWDWKDWQEYGNIKYHDAYEENIRALNTLVEALTNITESSSYWNMFDWFIDELIHTEDYNKVIDLVHEYYSICLDEEIDPFVL